MQTGRIRKIVIVGGGTSGWMAAAALSKVMGTVNLDITLVESEEIGTVGVGEATIPPIQQFNRRLGIDEDDFIRQTHATFKLGISFENWAREGDHYFHAFGTIGRSPWMVPFHHLWLQARAEGYGGELGDYCLELKAAEAGKFTTGNNGPLNYAYHLDASLYGQFLRRMSEAAGVRRVEGKIVRVDQDAQTGFITAVALEAGDVIPGDLFIDCTGFRGLLIEQTLKTGWEDWGHWLPTDRALAVQTESAGELIPYTRAIAHDAGWRWRIPLQHRTGNGYVYHSGTLEDDLAEARLMDTLDGRALSPPRRLKFQAGRRKSLWEKNVVAIGLSGGFLEPLESTSIHLIQTGIMRLLTHFPDASFSPASRRAFNRLGLEEYEQVRDLIIFHYKANERVGLPFWRDCREMTIPDSLAEKIALFNETGRIARYRDELFTEDSWLAVMLGQGIVPVSHDPVVDGMPLEGLERAVRELKVAVSRAAEALPRHAEFISAHCKAATLAR